MKICRKVCFIFLGGVMPLLNLKCTTEIILSSQLLLTTQHMWSMVLLFVICVSLWLWYFDLWRSSPHYQKSWIRPLSGCISPAVLNSAEWVSASARLQNNKNNKKRLQSLNWFGCIFPPITLLLWLKSWVNISNFKVPRPLI